MFLVALLVVVVCYLAMNYYIQYYHVLYFKFRNLLLPLISGIVQKPIELNVPFENLGVKYQACLELLDEAIVTSII